MVSASGESLNNIIRASGHEPDECEAAAAGVVQVETAIANIFLSHEQERAANSLPPLSFSQVAAGMSGQGPNSFDWLLYFRLLGVDEELLASPKKVRVLGVQGLWVRVEGLV